MVGVVRRIVRWRDDGCVEGGYGSDTVREAPVRKEQLSRILQVLLAGWPQVDGTEEGHDGVTHVSHAPAHGGLPHAEEGADGAVFDVGSEAPQSHGYALLHRQRQTETGVLSSQAGSQFVTEVEERLPAHSELIQPIGGLKFCHRHALPPIGARGSGPRSRADARTGADTPRQHHLECEGKIKSYIENVRLF